MFSQSTMRRMYQLEAHLEVANTRIRDNRCIFLGGCALILKKYFDPVFLSSLLPKITRNFITSDSVLNTYWFYGLCALTIGYTTLKVCRYHAERKIIDKKLVDTNNANEAYRNALLKRTIEVYGV